jgi:hypothetical protein
MHSDAKEILEYIHLQGSLIIASVGHIITPVHTINLFAQELRNSIAYT